MTPVLGVLLVGFLGIFLLLYVLLPHRDLRGKDRWFIIICIIKVLRVVWDHFRYSLFIGAVLGQEFCHQCLQFPVQPFVLLL